MSRLIYIADDEKHICSLIKTFLEHEGYQGRTFSDGYSVSMALREQMPDLLILDIMMPGEDGLSICSRVRKESKVPIIIVSAKDNPLDRVTGLMMGSDDYIIKPFLPLELSARVKALFRRAELSSLPDPAEARSLECGNLCLLPGPRQITIDQEPFPVTPMEFDFLHYMLQHKEQAVKKEKILLHVWNYSGDIESRMPDDLIKRLRKKMRACHATARIETVWGYGYRITEVNTTL